MVRANLGVSLVAVIIGILILASCAQPTVTPPEAEKWLTIGASLDLSGPLTGTHLPEMQALLSGINEINDAGGIEYKDPKTGKIEHVKIKALWADDKYKVDTIVSNYNRFKDQGAIVFVHGNTAADMALGSIAAKDRVPLLHGGQSPASIYPSYPERWTICPSLTYCDSFAAWGAWAAEQWKKEGNSLPVNIAGLTVDNPFGRSAYTPSAIKYIEDKGAKFVGLDFFAPGEVDLTPQITRIAEKNAQWIFTNQVAAPSTNIVRTLVKLGLKGKIRVCGNIYLFTEEYPRILGKDAEGEYGVNWCACLGEPGAAGMERAVSKYYPQAQLCLNHFDGWMYAYCIKTGFKVALENKGYPIDGEDFIKTVLSADGKGPWLEPSGAFPPVDFTEDPKDATGMHQCKITTCKDGKIVSITDWLKAPHLSYLDLGK